MNLRAVQAAKSLRASWEMFGYATGNEDNKAGSLISCRISRRGSTDVGTPSGWMVERSRGKPKNGIVDGELWTLMLVKPQTRTMLFLVHFFLCFIAKLTKQRVLSHRKKIQLRMIVTGKSKEAQVFRKDLFKALFYFAIKLLLNIWFVRDELDWSWDSSITSYRIKP